MQRSTATKYVTNAYSDPAGTNRGNLITAGIFVLIGLLTLASAIWVPVESKADGSRAAPNPARRTRYGAMVLAPIRRPSGTGSR